MRENLASILKQYQLGTLGGTIDFQIQQWRKSTIPVLVQAAGITIKSVYGLLFALEII